MRTKYSINNFITQLITNIISIIFLFIGQTLFIKILGIEYSGLNGLFANILTILNLFELGIGHSITFHLYKYVKIDDKETIKSIMNFYKKSYRYIAVTILLIGLLITPFLPFIVKEVSVDINIYFAYILFLLTTVATYILSYKRNIIIAHQRNYIINIINIISLIILNIIQIIILYFTKNYYLYLAIKIICILIENMIINLMANKLYPYLKDKNIKPIDKEIKNNIVNKVKALIIHKTSGAVTNGTDNILISAFFGLTTTGLFMSYNYIISSVKKIFGNIISSTTSSIGNLLIENNKEKNYQTFKKIRYLNFWISVFTATSILVLSEDFITLWLGKNYLLETSFLIVLTFNYYQTAMRSTFSTFKDAAGIWIEDKYVPLFQLTINIVSSIILLKIFGIIGVFLGTIVSSFTVWFYSYPKHVYKALFNKSYKDYYKELVKELLIFIVIILVTYELSKMVVFDSLIVTFILKMILVLFVPNILFILFNSKEYLKYYVSLLKRIIPRSINTFIIEHKYIISETKKRHKKRLKKMLINNQFKIDDENNWIKKFNRATYSDKKSVEIAEEFITSDFEIINNTEIKSNEVIAICVEKNDIFKLKKFIEHHRKLGIDKFVILDNNSNDGTIEYLLKQKDVVLLQTKLSYSSSRRIAWINRIIAHYGYNRWYFVADSDELLVYEDCEHKSIKDLIEYYKKHKIVRARAILLDMYAKKEYYTNGKIEKYYNECIYFDKNTYSKKETSHFYNIKGGPRKRLFEFNPCLTKYPLVYFRKKDIYIKSHYLYPYNDNFKSECNLVLKHYKFLPTEFKKFKEIAEKGNYFNGSIEYKHYMKVIEKDNKLDFFIDDTCEYKNSKSLNQISVYNNIKWK